MIFEGSGVVDQVNYAVLDTAKQQFIAAAQSTLDFASSYGKVPESGLGASANVFKLALDGFDTSDSLGLSLISEGLGTADDARPSDLTDEEAEKFWYNIGIKTVACLTNDVASSALQPLLLSLYLPSSTPETVFNPLFMKGFTDGIVEGCKTVGSVYISGETPQLKSKIFADKIDIAGAVIGIEIPGLPKIDRANFGVGNEIVFIESSGPHENGFTPIRELAARLPKGFRTVLKDGRQLWQAANAPSNLYVPLVKEILALGIAPTALENVSGHGWQKIMRSKLALNYIIRHTLPVPEIFNFLQEQLALDTLDMLEIFNYGVGFVVFVKNTNEADQVVGVAKRLGLNAVHAGSVENSHNEMRNVIIDPFRVSLIGESFILKY
jgi:phosphoribosylformylglycinamidine cyclo-ligase